MKAQKPSSDPKDRTEASTPLQSSRPSGPFRPLSPSEKKLPEPEGFIPPHGGYQTPKKGIEHPDPAICANVIVGLIKVTTYLLDRQLRRLERDFLNEGGLRERMTRARLAHRAKQNYQPPNP